MNLKDVMNLKEKIKIIVNGADPWYLIEAGAPEDEYNSYVDRIVSFVVNKKPNKESLKNELYLIFKTDESDLETERIEKLAENILNLKGETAAQLKN